MASFPRGGVLAVGCLVAALVLGGGAVLLSQKQAGPAKAGTSQPAGAFGQAKIGGPFHLTNQDGKAVDESVLKGKWSAVFFGYTFCPDFCPTNLQLLAHAQHKLGPKANNLQVVFVSIDPARDTPQTLKAYLSNQGFPKGAIGLTGTATEVAEAAKAYKVYYARSGKGSDYLMDHSTVTYLMDPQGRFHGVIRPDATPDEIAKQVSAAMGG